MGKASRNRAQRRDAVARQAEHERQRKETFKHRMRRLAIPAVTALIAAVSIAAVSYTQFGGTTKGGTKASTSASKYTNVSYFSEVGFGGNQSAITVRVPATPEKVGSNSAYSELLNCYTGTMWVQVGVLDVAGTTATNSAGRSFKLTAEKLVLEVFNSNGNQIYPTGKVGDYASAFNVRFNAIVRLSISVSDGKVTANANSGQNQNLGVSIADPGATECLGNRSGHNKIGEDTSVEEEIHQPNGSARLENPVDFKITRATASPNYVAITEDGLINYYSEIPLKSPHAYFNGNNASISYNGLSETYSNGNLRVAAYATAKRN